MTNITVSQALNGVVSFAGVKGDFAKLSAKKEVKDAALHAIIDGNSRPLDDTKNAIPKGLIQDKDATAQNGGVKMFKYANSMQGVVLAAIIAANVSSRQFYEALHANGLNSKNQPKYDKKLTPADKEAAEGYAQNIALAFVDFCDKGAAALKESRNQAADKTKATKAAKAAEVEKAQAEKAIKEAAEAEAAKKNTLTISEFLLAIKGGNVEALETAYLIAKTLKAYEASQAAKATKPAAKATKPAATLQAAA